MNREIWFSAGAILPDEHERVLIYAHDKIYLGYRLGDYFRSKDFGEIKANNGIYWRILPPPPSNPITEN